MSLDFPDTQPLATRPLAGVIAFVDVRSGRGRSENRSRAVAKHLDDLGATISNKMTRDVTHVVFKDGHSATLRLAKAYASKIVSVLWVDACISANDITPESKFPALYDENSDPVVLGKIKRIKSMQPKSIDEEEITRSVKKKRKGDRICLEEITTVPLKQCGEVGKKADAVKCKRSKCTMVFTSCHTSDQEMIQRVVCKLGGFTVKPSVGTGTSHVICGSVRRTYNILASSVLGCWILPLEWVWRSLETGCWLEEEKYDMSKEFPAAKLFREELSSCQPKLFQSVGPIFMSHKTNLSYDQLTFLLHQVGGKTTNCLRNAKVAVETVSKYKEVVTVNLDWLLDCISAHKLLSTESYLLSPQE